MTLQLLHVLLEAPAAALGGNAGCLVVVVASPDRDAQHEPAAGDGVHRGGLLGQQRGVAPVGSDEDGGGQPDALGHGCNGRERGQRLEVVVDQAVDDAHRGKARGVSAPTCLQHVLAAGSGDSGRHRVFRTYFVNERGDEVLGSVWSFLDITALGRQEEWEDSPDGYPQDPPYSWWHKHDRYPS